MSQYEVTRGGVSQAIEEMRRTTTKIDNDLNTLEAQTAAHLSEWLGEAQQAYRVEKANWDQAIVGMNQVLDKAGLTLGDILTNYNDTEQRATNAWQA